MLEKVEKTLRIIVITTFINLAMCYVTFKIAHVQIGVKCFEYTHEREKVIRSDVLNLHEKSVDEFMKIYEEYYECMKEIDSKFKMADENFKILQERINGFDRRLKCQN